jgi:glutaredoxin
MRSPLLCTPIETLYTNGDDKMKNGWSWLLLSLLVSASAHAQLYKWVGPDGKITYSDTPPPASAKKVEEKSVSTNSVSTAGLPFELAEAVRNNPVTLYTTTNCNACDNGRNALTTRGVPFTEKTVNTNEDIARLQQIGGGKQMPFLTIGSNKQTGFGEDTWNAALTAAGYPAASQLPRTYRNPAPQAAAPKRTETKPASEADAAPPSDTRPAAGNAPPGFRF